MSGSVNGFGAPVVVPLLARGRIEELTLPCWRQLKSVM